jgi:hypothetical protein
VTFRRYLGHIRVDGDLIAATAPGGLDRPVPVCAPWDVREVVAHRATVYALTRRGDESHVALLRSRLAAATQ